MEMGTEHQDACRMGRPDELYKERGLAGIRLAKPSIKPRTFSHMVAPGGSLHAMNTAPTTASCSWREAIPASMQDNGALLSPVQRRRERQELWCHPPLHSNEKAKKKDKVLHGAGFGHVLF